MKPPTPSPSLRPSTYPTTEPTPLVSRELVVGAAFGGIYQGDTTGGDTLRMYDEDADIHGTAFDAATGYYYWAVYGTGELHRGGNGVDDVVIIDNLDSSESLCIDSANATIYFGNRDTSSSGLMRADAVTGENKETVVTGTQVSGCAVDAATGAVYWTTYDDCSVMRVDPATGAVEAVVQGSECSGYRGIAIDSAADILYYADAGSSTIYASPMSFSVGATPKVVYTGSAPFQLALRTDTVPSRVYFTDYSLGVFELNTESLETKMIYDWPAAIGVSYAGDASLQ